MLLCIKTFPPPFNFLQLFYSLISLFIKTLNTPPCLYRIFFNISAPQLGYPFPPYVSCMCYYQFLLLNSPYTPLCSYKLVLHLIRLVLPSPYLIDIPFNYFIHINIFCLLTLFLKFFKSNYFVHIHIMGGRILLNYSVVRTDIRYLHSHFFVYELFSILNYLFMILKVFNIFSSFYVFNIVSTSCLGVFLALPWSSWSSFLYFLVLFSSWCCVFDCFLIVF